MQRNTIIEIVNHNRSTALERSEKKKKKKTNKKKKKKHMERGLNRFYVATTIVLSSAVEFWAQLFKANDVVS